MKVNDIISKLEKAGFKQTRAYRIVNINAEGGWLSGTYLGPVEFTTDDGVKMNHKFSVDKGEGLLNKGDKSVATIEAGEVVIFGSGLLNYLLKEKQGKKVAVVYKGMDTYKDGKKTIKAHQHEVLDAA